MSTLMYRLVLVHLLRATQLAGAISAMPLLALGLGLHAGWLIAAAFIGGLGSSVSGIAWDTTLQQHIPPDKLSRVASLDDLLSYAAIPVGQLSAGPLAHTFGARSECLAAALIWIVAALVPLAFQPVREQGSISTNETPP